MIVICSFVCCYLYEVALHILHYGFIIAVTRESDFTRYAMPVTAHTLHQLVYIFTPSDAYA